MARMIRKQLYLDVDTERKLKRLAARWKCSEAAVVRKAVESVPEGRRPTDEEILERLVAQGVIAPPEGPPMTPEEAEEIERELEEFARAHPDMPDPAQYVFEDREGR
jgi:predicted transcriptional regulator